MNKKTISTIGFIILFLLAVYQLTKDQELAKLGAVLDDYSRVDKIHIMIEGNRKIEINNNDTEMLEAFKDNLFPLVLIGNRQMKKQYKTSLGKKVYDIDFYVGNKIVFTESIYELSDEFQSTAENSFMIRNKHYIAMWKKNFVKLKMSDPESFINEIK